jgi:hypothetical protein
MQVARRFWGIVAVGLFLTIVSTATAKYSGGTGEPNNPYQIATAADLIALGETPADYDKHFILTADIDLDPNLPGRKVFDKAVIAPATENPNWYYYYQGTPFTGVFDGSGHTISHLTINGNYYLGLFGCLQGEVRRMGVVDVSIVGSSGYVGSLVGDNRGSLDRCYGTGTVSGWGYVGGLVGENWQDGNVMHCYTTCRVTGDWTVCRVTGDWTVGGLVGANDGTVANCYSAATIRGSATGMREGVGGLVGCYSPAGVLHSVWDVETSGLSRSAGGVGLTTAEMMDPQMLGLNGFANDPNWVLDPGRDYPRLAWEGRPGQIIPEPEIDWLGGRGTADEPYRIDTTDQLITLRRAGTLWDRHFLLSADINLDPNLPNMPIFAEAVIPSFMGSFDGNGHTISHLTIVGKDYLGLFGCLLPGAEVKNLGVVDVSITGSGSYLAALVGAIGTQNSEGGLVTECYSTGAVTGGDGVGGLVGVNCGTLVECRSACVVSSAGVPSPGGMMGHVGGLVGGNGRSVTHCHSTGAVTCTAFSDNSCAGGLVGDNGGSVTQCYSTGAVTGGYYAGGLVGGGGGSVTQCYSTGAVTGGCDAGGLVGLNYQGTVTQCYSTGTVSGAWSVGGLVYHSFEGTVTACFWDTQTSGQTESDGGTGKTTAEMQAQSTFLEAGWDFVGETTNGTEDIWWIDEGKDYPRLWWEGDGTSP